MPYRILLFLTVCALMLSGCYATLPKATAPNLTASATEDLTYPAPVSALTPIPAALPYSDCIRTPGILGCNPSAPRLAGHMAFYDAEKNRLVGIDLKTGQGWAVLMPKPKGMEWSPDGSQLLVEINRRESDRHEFLLLGKDGKLIQSQIQEKDVHWQSQGAVLSTDDNRQPKIARSPDGAEAWLERTSESAILHFRPSEKAGWKTAAIDMVAKELPLDLYGWLPGTCSIIIGQWHMSTYTNASQGQDFFMFNTQTGELSYLKGFNGHLYSQAAATQGSNLAIIDLYPGNDTLAILNAKTGEISRPLPRVQGEVQPYIVRQMAWQPGQNNREGMFALMVKRVPDQPIRPLFPTSGIYLYDRKSGQALLIRETPDNMIGGNFYWTTDGQYLLYNLGPENSDQKTQASLYIRQISTGTEWLMLDHLMNPDVFGFAISWNLIAVHMEE